MGKVLLDLAAFPSFDVMWMLLLALMLISFLVAYGLWHFAKWAWVISFILSIFGVISTISLLGDERWQSSGCATGYAPKPLNRMPIITI
jgi:hypothetical protein